MATKESRGSTTPPGDCTPSLRETCRVLDTERGKGLQCELRLNGEGTRRSLVPNLSPFPNLTVTKGRVCACVWLRVGSDDS